MHNKIVHSSSLLDMMSSRNLPDPIRLGVIGVGNMGQHHTRVLSRFKMWNWLAFPI